MGAGCYYTHKGTGTKAFWIDIDPSHQNEAGEWETNEHLLEDTVFNLGSELEAIGWKKYDVDHFYNGFYDLYMESTYYGDGIVFRMEPLAGLENQLYGLAMHNFDKSYDKLARWLNKCGYTLRIATSPYTSGKYYNP